MKEFKSTSSGGLYSIGTEKEIRNLVSRMVSKGRAVLPRQLNAVEVKNLEFRIASRGRKGRAL